MGLGVAPDVYRHRGLEDADAEIRRVADSVGVVVLDDQDVATPNHLSKFNSSGIRPSSSRLTPCTSTPAASSRSRSGRNVGCSTMTRSPNRRWMPFWLVGGVFLCPGVILDGPGDCRVRAPGGALGGSGRWRVDCVFRCFRCWRSTLWCGWVVSRVPAKRGTTGASGSSSGVGEPGGGGVPAVFEGGEESVFDFGGDVAVGLDDAVVEVVPEWAGLGDFGDLVGASSGTRDRTCPRMTSQPGLPHSEKSARLGGGERSCGNDGRASPPAPTRRSLNAESESGIGSDVPAQPEQPP
ncbi:hypothetical protein SAMN05216266_11458 [Amycolatopsis marina]|uniref:Uncharacterized protein n=1 Tax=Amycolatopsis marina TaxID=490629 RepID=A0A1I1BGQ8_9PSEU|nr:hypothetical protein SAMN05216266_11458 [Amycolatopsis marina]